MSEQNPLLTISTLPNKAPAFEQIKPEHYLPAIEKAIEEARANYNAIKNNEESPSFENTLLAMESASETLGTVSSIFYNQLSCMGGDDLHALVEKIGPLSANFSSDIILDEKLFARIKTVHDQIDS
ncbi:MAG: peptidase M3, partial [Micavibrio sp.]|nr:peptidase M3 [Micavibrio sp.]